MKQRPPLLQGSCTIKLLYTSDALIARNTLLNLMGFSLPVVAAVFCIPVVVAKLGLEMFGILALTWTINNYALMFDLGVTQGITKFTSELHGRFESREEAAILWSGVCIQTLMSAFGMAVIVLVASHLAYDMLRATPEHIGEARRSFFILASSMPAILVSNSFRGFLEALQRFDMVNAVKAPVNLSVFLIPLLGALAGWKLPEIMLAMTVFRYLGLGAYMGLVNRARPGIFEKLNIGLAFRKARQLVGFGKWVAVSSIVSPALVYSDRFLIGVLVSASAVAYYSAPHEMITRFSIITMSMLTTLFPAFSYLHSTGERERILVLISSGLKYILLVVGPIMITVVFFSEEILLLWLGGDFAQNSKRVLQVLAVGIFINSFAYLPFYLLRAARRPDLPAKLHLIELPVYFVLLFALVKSYGILGAAFAWTVRCAIDAILLYLAAHRVIGLTISSIAAERVQIIFLLFTVSCLLSAVVGFFGTGLVMNLILLSVVIAGFYFFSWAWVLKRSFVLMRQNITCNNKNE